MITRSQLASQHNGLLAVACLAGDRVALLGQHLGEVQADQRLVLHHEHPQTDALSGLVRGHVLL
jgi:hypothetical protein